MYKQSHYLLFFNQSRRVFLRRNKTYSFRTAEINRKFLSVNETELEIDLNILSSDRSYIEANRFPFFDRQVCAHVIGRIRTHVTILQFSNVDDLGLKEIKIKVTAIDC